MLARSTDGGGGDVAEGVPSKGPTLRSEMKGLAADMKAAMHAGELNANRLACLATQIALRGRVMRKADEQLRSRVFVISGGLLQLPGLHTRVRVPPLPFPSPLHP